MKVLMLNTFDEIGGAARAAVRLLSGVRKQGIASSLLVQFKTGNRTDIISSPSRLRKLLRRLKLLLGLLPVRMYPKKPENNFSPSLLPDKKLAEIAAINPDIIHLHWLCAGFLQIETIGRLGKPLIWTLHDSWAFTGGCHVPFQCQKYQQRCGSCPILGSSKEKDLSRRTWNRKAKAWQKLNLTVVAPSRWLADCARSSSLFGDVRVEVIPNGLDTELFQPKDKETARNLLNLPKDRKIILFGAVRGNSDPNKGFHLLNPALLALSKNLPNTMAVVFSSFDTAEIPELGMPVACLGEINDDNLLASIYSAADVFVAPSLLENLPNTVMEAMACGTPCVAFRQGGLADLIDHKASGYLALPYDIEDLAQGIAWVLENKDRQTELALKARQKIKKEFNIEEVSNRYIKLYRELLTV